MTATEAERVQPESQNAPAHEAFTRLLTRLEPDAETLWNEAKTQIDIWSGILVLDVSTLNKPFSRFYSLVYRHYSGKHKEVVSGINLIGCQFSWTFKLTERNLLRINWNSKILELKVIPD